MIRLPVPILFVSIVCLTLLAGQGRSQEKTDFAHDVLPILRNRCAKCHSNGTYKGGFSIDTRATLIESGVVEPGNPQASDLIERVSSDDPDFQMPPEGDRLSAEQVAALKKWIADDLAWEPGFTFKAKTWVPPITPRQVLIPEGERNPIDVVLSSYYFADRPTQKQTRVNDQKYLRRVYLDLIGVLPSMEEQQAFYQDDNPDKRKHLVRKLLDRKRDYADHWMTFWNDLLRNDYVGTGYIDGGRKQITAWLHQSLYENKPYDQFVRELIDPKPEAEGFIRGIKWRGNVNASQTEQVQFAQNVTQVFLGENLKCASCHDSFIDDWKLSDAYGMAAIVADQPLEMFRCDVPTGKTARAAFLWPQLGTIDPEQPKAERLKATAEIMTGPNNGRFTRTIANRIWQRLMGQGIIEPVDMMSNRPFSPELLDYLANHLKNNQYDLKKLLELIATSEAYQSDCLNQAETASYLDYTGPLVRRLTAEQFVDAVWSLTGSGPQKINAPISGDQGEESESAVVRASLVISDNLMRSLGRPNRDQVVTTRPDHISTLQALDLSNGKPLFDMINQGAKNHLAVAQEDPGQFASAFFQQALCRQPTETERQILTELLQEKPSLESVADMIWTVVMMPEFQYVR